MYGYRFKLGALFVVVLGFMGLAAIRPTATFVSKAAPLSAPVATPLSAGSAYTITDLGTLGGTQSEAYDINLAGTVVGWSYTITGANRAVVWYTTILSGNAIVTATVDLGTLGGNSSTAYGVSGNGRVAGASTSGNGLNHAFEWSAGSLTDLGTLPGGPFMSSTASDVNLAGVVVGSSVTTDTAPYSPGNRAFKWDGTMTDLGTLPDGINSGASAINDNNTIVGWANTHVDSSWYPRAVRWQGSAPEELGVLPGQSPTHTSSGASDINSLGQIVGDSYADPSGLYTSPFYWSMGTLTDLLAGQNRLTFPYGNASGINNKGQVVGVAGSTSFRTPVMWQNGAMYLLQNLIPAGTGWDLKYAYAINDKGQIVGYGSLNGQTHAFIMTPVPRVFLPLILR
jgi:probable HAF family extracellular repeat protein